MNVQAARRILNSLKDNGVNTLCLCPGARNAAFVELLQNDVFFEVLSFFDERSAGFFALGRAQRDERPVAVLTTSGTAVSELLSPVIEAFYACVPLIVLSSDRPKRLRGTGAPQSIDQSQIFANYVEKSFDIEASEPFELIVSGNSPLHINICFDEPLLDETIANEKPLSNVMRWKAKDLQSEPLPSFKLSKALVVVGKLNEKEALGVEKALSTVEAPIFVEAASGLRGSEVLQDRILQGGEKIVAKLLKSREVEQVIRIGDVPLGRYWRDLDQMNIEVISLSSKPWSGTDKSKVYQTDLSQLNLGSFNFEKWSFQKWLDEGREKKLQVSGLLKKFPDSEVGLVSQLQTHLASFDTIYIGNSLPVRHWDLTNDQSRTYSANRGVNGIDGQLSTALGLMKPDSANLVLLGDLTTLYDFSGFWLSEYLRSKKISVQMVVINNGGGQIFSRIFLNPLFRNEHRLSFKPLAQMWGWDYQELPVDSEMKFSRNLKLIEWKPDKEQTDLFWQGYDELWKT